MMGPFGYGPMMDWGGLGLFGTLIGLILLIDLILLGVWLWKKIQEK